MINAKDELINILSEYQDKSQRILCASILYDFYYDTKKPIILKQDYAQNEFIIFLKELDFEYDNSYGTRQIYGIVLFNDGSWLERHKYDGREEWVFKSCPAIPKECLQTNKI
jgi:hypothetical protein